REKGEKLVKYFVQNKSLSNFPVNAVWDCFAGKYYVDISILHREKFIGFLEEHRESYKHSKFNLKLEYSPSGTILVSWVKKRR
ncbi:hypothetical protein K0B04_00415, partial [Patescibacteria group bacterium]|nr:hypothetical protein [Patescibacteria group bacterium]